VVLVLRIILRMPPSPPSLNNALPEPLKLRARAFALWQVADPTTKARGTQALWAEWQTCTARRIEPRFDPQDSFAPGRPDQPRLVPPREVPSRSPHTTAGRAALLHAIAHIEFNAINLALDAAWRFDDMPDAFHIDWLRVAAEESLHFSLLVAHLQTLGHQYGDFDAHDGLWLMTQRTAHDVVARMALVPRTLEARGLDATPPLQARFAAAGDARAVEILQTILTDEIGHVAVGNHWYRWLCERDGLDTVAHDALLVERYAAPRLRPPFNRAARLTAGFTTAEVDALDTRSR
jgi:uncharacterized ferritin-like protein (DUF455 family)